MKRTRAWVALVCLVLLLVGGDALAQGQAKPVKLSEVKRMIDADQTPRQVLEALVERGAGFRVTASAEAQLGKWGFSAEQVELVKKIAAGEAVDLDAGPAPGAPQADGPGGEAQQPDAAEFPVGYPSPAHWHGSEQRRIERAIEAAGLGYKRQELTRCTLYCSDARAQSIVPMLKELEATLIKQFPPSVSNACSPKSAHIVIVDGESEWRSWLDACFDSYEKDRMKFSFGPDGGDPREQLKDSSGYVLPACAVSNANIRDGEEANLRYAAYALGHLMMSRAGGDKQPHGLKLGFGNVAEVLAMGSPSVMLYSYEKRDLNQGDAWRASVLKRFNNKQIDDATKVWGYETATMKGEEYAECWSLVGALCEAPDKFALAVAKVREDGAFMNEAVREVYGLGDVDLLKAWYKYVSR